MMGVCRDRRLRFREVRGGIIVSYLEELKRTGRLKARGISGKGRGLVLMRVLEV